MKRSGWTVGAGIVAALACFGVPASGNNTQISTSLTFRAVDERIPAKPRPAPGKPKGPAHVGETVVLNTQPGPLKLTITKLEFTAGRVMLGDNDLEFPSDTEKLLVVHYTLENPTTSELDISGKTVRFTALDFLRNPHQDVEAAASEDGDVVDGPLEAGGKIDAVKVVHVPARGPIAAILVTPGPAGLNPLHVDVTGQIAKLGAPFADPQDPTGATVLPAVEGRKGDPYPFQNFDLAFESAEYSQDPLLGYSGEVSPDQDHIYAVFKFDLICRDPHGASFRLDNLNATLATADGVQLEPANAPLLNGMLDIAFDSSLQFGDERHFRVYFVMSTHDAMESLSVRPGEHGRKYVYDLSDVQKPPE